MVKQHILKKVLLMLFSLVEELLLFINLTQLEIILQSIQRNVKLGENYEFTFETTLHNLTEEKLEVMWK